MRLSYLFILILWSVDLIYGQPLQDFGGAKSETIHQMIENGEGDIVAIGTTTSDTEIGKDIYFLIVDKEGQVIVEKNIGRVGNEEGFSLIQAFDGTYLLVGYTTTLQNKKKGWIVNIGNNGKVLWDKIDTEEGESQFKEIVQLDDGSLCAVGEQNQQISLFHFEENGNPIQTIPIATLNGTATSLCKLPNGNVIISGQEHVGKEQQVFLLEATLTGNTIWKQNFPKEDIAISEDCIQTFDGGFVLVGSTYRRPPLKEEIALVKTNPQGKIKWARTFGGKGVVDRATALIQLPNTDLMVTGRTTSHKRGAKRSDFWLHRIGTKEGLPIWDKSKNFGEDYNDEGNSVIRLRDGTIRLGGQKWTKLKEKEQACIIPFTTKVSEGIVGNTKLLTEFIHLRETNNNADAFDIEGTIKSIHKEKGLLIPNKIYIDRIPAGQSSLISIPLSANEKVRSGMNELSVQFKARNSQATIDDSFFVESKKKPVPQLEFTVASILSDSVHYFEKPTKLVLKITNIGSAVAEQFTCKINFPTRLRTDAQEEEVIAISSILPNQEQFISLDFTISPKYVKDDFSINCLAYDKNYQYQTGFDIDRQITVPVTAPTSTFTSIAWVVPNNASSSEPIITQDSVLDIKVKAFSTQPLPKASFRTFVNHQLIVTGKNKPVDYYINDIGIDSLVLDDIPGRYTHTYVKKTLLKEGQNQIQVKVKNKAGSDTTNTILVHYKPAKPNLHILSIGVPADDLKYTATDAEDIKEKFEQQRGLIYSKKIVVSELLNTNPATKAGEIKKAIEKLKTLSRSNTIKSNDVLVLFISAHGIPDEGDQFRIQGSDFDNLYPDAASIPFRDNLLKILGSISCRKLVFFDACFSGNSIQSLEAIKAIPNLELLLSSSPNEESYEDEEWGHGAFTKALLECFEKLPNTSSSRLTMDDIALYIKQRVPDLVKQKKLKKSSSQTPILIRSKGTIATPIIEVID